MTTDRSFKFLDEDLNRLLISALKRAKLKHRVAADGLIHYAPGDEEVVENDLIASIRDKVFPSWQILSCPKSSARRYQQYMTSHDIAYREELADNQLCFLISGEQDPHAWKLAQKTSSRR